jgi:phosphoglycolate phosphatase
VIDHLGFAGRFAAIAGALDGERHTKADVIGVVLEQLGPVDGDHLVMVGDRRYDVEGAAAHGIDTIGVAWGYGSVAELGAAGAWAIAHHPSDVVALVADRSA